MGYCGLFKPCPYTKKYSQISQNSSNLDYTNQCCKVGHSTQESTQHSRAGKTKKPKTPDRLPSCWQRFVHHKHKIHRSISILITSSCCENMSPYMWLKLCWQTKNKKQTAAHRQALLTVCLHRASEQASPLTGAATTERSRITLELSFGLLWQLTLSAYLLLNIQNILSVNGKAP